MSRVLPLVAVFCRAPRPGHTKTRLEPGLGADGAAALSTALLLDIAVALTDPRWDLEFWAASERDRGPLVALVGDAPVRVQPEGDLGQRMAACFVRGAESHRPATVIVGSDCPAITAAHVTSALDALDGADAAICPGRDGGYGLIAARAVHPPLFQGIGWGGGEVAAQTRDAARTAGLALSEPCLLDDIDEPEDLADLLRDPVLAQNPTPLGRTRAVLAMVPRQPNP